MMRLRPYAVALGLVLPLGCGGEEGDERAPPGPFALDRVDLGSLASGATRTVAMPSGPVEALGVDARARPVVVVSDGVRVLNGASFERRRLYAEPGDPTRLGRVHGIRPRADGGAWLAADAGLFVLDPTYVLPFATDLGPVRQIVEITGGPLAGLWILTPTALYRSSETELTRYEPAPSPRAIAIDAGGRRAVIAGEAGVSVVDPRGSDLEAHPLPFDPGLDPAVAATADTLWLAGETGLFALDVRGPVDGWRRIDLAEGPIRVRRLDAEAGAVVLHDEQGRLLRFEDRGGTLRAAGTDDPGAQDLAADGRGGVWRVVAGEAGLRLDGLRLDAAPTFARDVVPFVEAHCAACHGAPGSDYRTYEVFAPRAEAALLRIRAGDMPRCAGDLPCPEDQRLTPDTYATLERWIEEGKLR